MVPAHYNGYDIMKEETKQMGLMKKLTSAIVASSLVFTLVGSASAAYTADAGNTAATRMQALKIVQGMPDGTLGLDKEITRAELVTIIVRAFGQEDNAKLLQGSAAFTDSAKHWASGNIAMAQALVAKVGGDAIGMPDGSFAPDAKLTPAQAVAFLMKFLGVKADAAKAWPANYLDKAADMGLIAADDKAMIAGQANTNATRGLAFYLFDRAFASYQLPTGKTFYTQYVDQTAPELTIKNEAAATTMDASVTVTGTVTGASELYVGTTKVTPDANGNFSADVALGEVKADPYTITVTARDLAGNKTEKSIQVTRTVGAAATIEASDITVAAGGTANVTVAVKDAKGNVLAGQTVTGTSTVGTFAAGVFTAGKTVGTGKLTLTVGTLTKDVNVTVTAGAIATVKADKTSVGPGEFTTLKAYDANGNEVIGVTFTQTSANAMLDATTGRFMASKAGQYTVTATKDGATATGTIGVYGDINKVVVTAPETILANGVTTQTVTVSVTDKNGNVRSDWNGNVKISSDLLGSDGKTALGTLFISNGTGTFDVTAPADLKGNDVVISVEALNPDDSNKSYATKVEGDTTISAIAQVPTSLAIDGDEYLNANVGGEATLTITVLDQAGEDMVDGTWRADVAVTGAAKFSDDSTSTTVPVTMGDGGTVTLVPTDTGDTGNATVTATFTGLASATATVKSVVAQSAYKVNMSNVTTSARRASGEQAFVSKVQITDKNGVPVNVDADTTVSVAFDVTDSVAAQLTALAESTDKSKLTASAVAAGTTFSSSTKKLDVTVLKGTNTAYIGVIAQKYVGDVSMSASNDDLVKGAATTVSFKAGTFDHLSWTRNEIDVLQTAPTAQLTIQAQDKAGNNVAVSGIEVDLKAYNVGGGTTTDRVTLDNKTVYTDANGVATVGFTALAYQANYELNATASYETESYDVELDGATANLPVKVMAAIAKSLSVSVYDAADKERKTTVTADDVVTVRVYVKDSFDNYMTDTDHQYDAFTIKATSGSIVEAAADIDWAKTTTVDSAGHPYFSTTVTAKASGLLTLEVADKTVAANVTANRSVSVNPGAATKVVVDGLSTTAPEITLDSGVAKAFTFVLKDKYGNVVNGTSVSDDLAVTYTFTAVTGTNTYTDVRTSTGASLPVSFSIKKGTSSRTVYLIANGTGTTKFTATIGDGTVKMADINVTVK